MLPHGTRLAVAVQLRGRRNLDRRDCFFRLCLRVGLRVGVSLLLDLHLKMTEFRTVTEKLLDQDALVHDRSALCRDQQNQQGVRNQEQDYQ